MIRKDSKSPKNGKVQTLKDKREQRPARRVFCRSVSKFEDGVINEDAALARPNLIAISDGAGGGGVYAERWSRYLLDNLPSKPITTFEELDYWIDQIWEPFYKDCEEEAKKEGGMLLDKFYDEGSFATLVAVWRDGDECQWMSYGDSVAFCYSKGSGGLEHSFTRLGDFNNPPYLISCKDELKKEGFRSGKFACGPRSIVFAASDTLAHYILMMYEVCKSRRGRNPQYRNELTEALNMHTKNSNFISAALNIERPNLGRDGFYPLIRALKSEKTFKQHLQQLISQGLMGHDDYSFALLPNP